MTISRMLQPRQQYGLGSLVKSIGKGVKKFVKSPLGKAALVGLASFGMPNTTFGGLFGRASIGGKAMGMLGHHGIGPTLGSFFGPQTVYATSGTATGPSKFANLFKGKGKWGVGGGLAAFLLSQGMGEEEVSSLSQDPEKLRKYLRLYHSQTNPLKGDKEIDEWVEKNMASGGRVGLSRGMAQGGRIGFEEGGWDSDNLSDAAEDFGSTDTAANFADLGSGGGGQNHDWSNDIGTVGTGIRTGAGTGITSNYMNPTFRKATIDFLNKPKGFIANLPNRYVKENIQLAGGVNVTDRDEMKQNTQKFVDMYHEGKYDNLQLAIEDAERYNAGEKTNYEITTGRSLPEIFSEKLQEGVEAYEKNVSESQKRQQELLKEIGAAEGGRVGLSRGMAQGGRIGYRDAGGVKMASASNPMDDKNQISLQLFGKPLHDLSKDEIIELDLWLEDKAQKWQGAQGGRIGLYGGDKAQAAGIMGQLPVRQNKAGVSELDLRDTGGFIPPVGVKEKADDVPAMLSNNEFVWTADAVRAAGGGSVDKGAQILYDQMKKLENRIV